MLVSKPSLVFAVPGVTLTISYLVASPLVSSSLTLTPVAVPEPPLMTRTRSLAGALADTVRDLPRLVVGSSATKSLTIETSDSSAVKHASASEAGRGPRAVLVRRRGPSG